MERQESSENSCTVCHEHTSVWAVGPCDHPICYRCLTRMRILCKQLYCAICRSDLSEVLFMTNLRKFSECNRKKFIPYWKHKIFFDTQETRQLYFKLLENRCYLCPDRNPEPSFQALKDHMRKEHSLLSCDLCLKNLQLFSSERKFYSRKDLVVHRRSGDPDDKSYKGHPLCEFCDERYMDKDELHAHLRKDHYFCHFCDAHGTNEYYNDYPNLREHFKAGHYLCEEGQCASPHVRFTNAFRSEIDLKAHFAQEHSHNLSKAQMKEVRTLDIEIQMTRRRKPHERGMVSREDFTDSAVSDGRNVHQRQQRPPRQHERERDNVEKALAASLKESLKNDEREMRDVERKRRQAVQEEEVQRLKEEQTRRTSENFPSLSDSIPPERAIPPTSQHSTNTRRPETGAVLNSDDYPSLTTTVTTNTSKTHTISIANASAVGYVSNASSKPLEPDRPKSSSKPRSITVKNATEDFPELGRHSPCTSANSVGLMSLGVWSAKNQKKDQFSVIINGDKDIRSKNNVEKVKSKASNNNVHVDLGSTSEDQYPQLSKQVFTSTEWVKIPKSAKNKKSSNNKSTKSQETNNLDKEVSVNSSDETKPKTKKKKKKSKDKTDKQGEETTTRENKNNGNVAGSTSGKAAESSRQKKKAWEKPADVDSGYSESSSGSLDGIAFRLLDEKAKESKQKETNDEFEAVDIVPKLPKGKPLNMRNKFEILQDEDATNEENTKTKKVSSKTSSKPFTPDDFPSLTPIHATTAPIKAGPPPGLIKFKAAPPGFDRETVSERPPPGFTLNTFLKETMACSLRKPLFATAEKFEYSKPKDFLERNRKLVDMIASLLKHDQELFNQFKSYSGLFRQNLMSAADYYKSCQQLLGEESFNRIISELISLLPDIQKQQELLSVHSEASKSAFWWDSLVNALLTCTRCRQVLEKKDYDEHIAEHTQLSDFPTLDSKLSGQASWIKAK